MKEVFSDHFIADLWQTVPVSRRMLKIAQYVIKVMKFGSLLLLDHPLRDLTNGL